MSIEQGGEPLTPHELTIRQLGHWRSIGQTAFMLAVRLDDVTNGLDELSPDQSVSTLEDLAELDADMAAAEEELGDDALPDSLGHRPEVEAAIDLFYKYGPLAKAELRALSEEDRRVLSSQKFRDNEDTLDDRLRLLVERTHQWETAGASSANRDDVDTTGQPSRVWDAEDGAWTRFPEGPRQVRRAAIALFHFLADDRFLVTGSDYEPPDYVLRGRDVPGTLPFIGRN